MKIIRTICLLNGTNVARKEKEEKGKKGKEILRIEKFFLYERDAFDRSQIYFEVWHGKSEKKKLHNQFEILCWLCAGYPIYLYTQRDITKLIVIK